MSRFYVGVGLNTPPGRFNKVILYQYRSVYSKRRDSYSNNQITLIKLGKKYEIKLNTRFGAFIYTSRERERERDFLSARSIGKGESLSVGLHVQGLRNILIGK